MVSTDCLQNRNPVDGNYLYEYSYSAEEEIPSEVNSLVKNSGTCITLSPSTLYGYDDDWCYLYKDPEMDSAGGTDIDVTFLYSIACLMTVSLYLY